MLNELSKEIHANAVAHGWWDEQPDFATVIALIHSELSEALEEYRDGMPMMYYLCQMLGEPCDTDNCPSWCAGACSMFARDSKPEGVAVELADCVIRILDYCAFRKLDIDAAIAVRCAAFDTYRLPEVVAECHYLLACGYKDIEPRLLYLAECINLITFWLKESDVNLIEIIRLKHEHNKTRLWRHGGKVI